MGDRTTVFLYIPESFEKQAERIIHPNYSSKELCSFAVEVPLTCYEFSEVNYGDLFFLERLAQAGIPYSSEWARGSEYGSGQYSCRFDDEGCPVLKTIYENEKGLPVAELYEAINDTEKLQKMIMAAHEYLEIIPWGTQERNSKLYLTKQLIGIET